MKKLLYLTIIATTLYACLPPSTPYPNANPTTIVAQAQTLSDSLESYIIKWTQGLVPNSIPDSLIPQGITDSRNFYLKNADSTTGFETWAVRYAKPINHDSLLGGIPDPKVTYLFLGSALAPFGSKLIIEGEFPHCRFFSIQVTPPLNGKEYYAQRQFGTAEVGWADADIEPNAGSINPFRVGANRNATNRSYKVEVDLTTGDPVTLNDTAFQYPYRENTNNRKGAMMVYQGPLGHQTVIGTALPANQQGDWNLGAVWIRIYEPDNNVDRLGGVPLPKAYFQLPNGDKYFVGSDFSALQRRADTTIANRVTAPGSQSGYGPAAGWYKSWGITRSMLNGVCISNNWHRPDSSARVRAIDLGWTGRGEFQPAPGNYEPHATTNNYATYLGRTVSLAPGMVAVLTGKLPTFPSTRNGEPTMTSADVRYWSIIGLDQDPLSPMPATTIHAITDDEVTIDGNRNYVICYSRDTERPTNAYAGNGVSWVNYGTQSDIGLLMRWVNVKPEWTFPYDPHEANLDFSHSDWSGTLYDSSLIGINWRNGFMQCYLPRVHYMTKAQFEAIGSNVNAENVPVWVDSSYTNAGPAQSRFSTVTVSSVADTAAVNAGTNLIDGNMNSAWSSLWGVPLCNAVIDLGSVKKISAVKLNWDWIFFGKDYTIQVSNDNITYTTIATSINGNGAVDLYSYLQNVSGRYVKLDLTNYNAGYYRLGEFEVFTTDCNCGNNATVGINSNTETGFELNLYPNPASEFITVKTNVREKASLQIYDLQGKLWLDKTISTGITTISTSELPVGTYIAVIADSKKRITKRFVKIK